MSFAYKKGWISFLKLNNSVPKEGKYDRGAYPYSKDRECFNEKPKDRENNGTERKSSYNDRWGNYHFGNLLLIYLIV
ncbi:MAG TPA: hypothetical protein DCZ10_02610 [Pelotomaculum sp.]|nr:hypothetical protein [Pelotomaculum sp.]